MSGTRQVSPLYEVTLKCYVVGDYRNVGVTNKGGDISIVETEMRAIRYNDGTVERGWIVNDDGKTLTIEKKQRKPRKP